MKNLRLHGPEPYNIALVHGGPGARGEMYPVARELSRDAGILEPLQSALSVEGQVEELKAVLEKYGHPPVFLIGFSWGAWLSWMLTAHHPSLVKKLVLVSSGVFESQYTAKIMETRLSHLNAAEKQEALSLMSALDSKQLDEKGFARFGELMGKADTFDPLPRDIEACGDALDAAAYQAVWPEASKLRSSGKLLQLGERIQCPVVVIHGDYDPHPYEGVQVPLSRILKDVRFILLEKCGHHPWLERQAKDNFYRILREEIFLHV